MRILFGENIHGIIPIGENRAIGTRFFDVGLPLIPLGGVIILHYNFSDSSRRCLQTSLFMRSVLVGWLLWSTACLGTFAAISSFADSSGGALCSFLFLASVWGLTWGLIRRIPSNEAGAIHDAIDARLAQMAEYDNSSDDDD